MTEDNTIINETLIPNKFCNYFTSIAEQLVSNIPAGQFNPVSFLRNRNVDYFFVSPIICEDIGNAISDLKDNGCGLYKLSTKLLIKVKPTLCKILEYVFNLCVNKGYFPEELKIIA